MCGIYGCGVAETKGKEYEQRKQRYEVRNNFFFFNWKKKKESDMFDVNNKFAKVVKVGVLVIISLKLPRD